MPEQRITELLEFLDTMREGQDRYVSAARQEIQEGNDPERSIAPSLVLRDIERAVRTWVADHPDPLNFGDVRYGHSGNRVVGHIVDEHAGAPRHGKAYALCGAGLTHLDGADPDSIGLHDECHEIYKQRTKEARKA